MRTGCAAATPEKKRKINSKTWKRKKKWKENEEEKKEKNWKGQNEYKKETRKQKGPEERLGSGECSGERQGPGEAPKDAGRPRGIQGGPEKKKTVSILVLTSL